MRGVTQFHPPVQLLVSLDAQFAHGIALMAIDSLVLDALRCHARSFLWPDTSALQFLERQ